jgi:hypothetical protein
MKYILLVFLIINFSNIFCDEEGEDYKFKIRIKGKYYFVDEPIVFTIVLCNEGNKIVKIPKFFEAKNKNFKIEIKPETTHSTDVKEDTRALIVSNSSINKDKEFDIILPNKDVEIAVDLSQLVDKLGRYRIKVTYEGVLILEDDMKKKSTTKKADWISQSLGFFIVEKNSKVYEDYNNFKVLNSGKKEYFLKEPMIFTLSLINEGDKVVRLPAIYKPYENSFPIDLRMISSSQNVHIEVEGRAMTVRAPTDGKENWVFINPKSSKDFQLNISERIQMEGEYEIKVSQPEFLTLIDSEGQMTISKKCQWESLKTTFKVIEKIKHEEVVKTNNPVEIKIIKPEPLPNFKIVENIDKLRFMPLTKQYLDKFSDFINDERIVGSAGFSNPLNLNYYEHIRICDFGAFGLEAFLNGDESVWRDVPRFEDYVKSESVNWRQKLLEFKKLTISEIGRALLSNAIENKKYSNQKEILQLSMLLYRWLNFDFEVYNRTIVHDGNIEDVITEIKKWWAENKSLEFEFWVVNAEKLCVSEKYTKIRNDSLSLNKKRKEEFQVKRNDELNKLKQNDLELYNGLVKLEQLFDSPPKRLIALKWIEDNKLKFLGTVFETEIVQAGKNLTVFIMYDQKQIEIK